MIRAFTDFSKKQIQQQINNGEWANYEKCDMKETGSGYLK